MYITGIDRMQTAQSQRTNATEASPGGALVEEEVLSKDGSTKLRAKRGPMGTNTLTHMPLQVEVERIEESGGRDGSTERAKYMASLKADSSTPLHIVETNTPFNEEAPSH